MFDIKISPIALVITIFLGLSVGADIIPVSLEKKEELMDLTKGGIPAEISFASQESFLTNRDWAPAAIHLTGGFSNLNVIGLGLNIAHSDYKYVDFSRSGTGISNEWGSIHSQHLPHPNDDLAWERFFKYLDFINPRYVRIGTNLTFWEPKNDNNDPYKTNNEGFVWGDRFSTNSNAGTEQHKLYLVALHRLLGHLDDKGVYVQIANWTLGGDTFAERVNEKAKIWLSRRIQAGEDIPAVEAHHDEPYDIAELTESLAAIVHYLRVTSGHESVKAISVFNEPEVIVSPWARANGVTPELYQARIYKSLKHQLQSKGVGSLVDIVGFDGAGLYASGFGSDRNRVGKLLRYSEGAVGVVGLHNYTSDLNYKGLGPYEHNLQGTVQSHLIDHLLTPVLRDIKQFGGEQKVIFGELGTSAYPVGGDRADSQQVKQRIHNAEASISLLNKGVKGIGFWTLNDNNHSKWRLLTYPYPDTSFRDRADYSKVIAQKESFYPIALMTKFIKKGSDVMSSSVTGGIDGYGEARVSASIFYNRGKHTVLIVNTDEVARAVTIKGLKKNLLGMYVSESEYQQIYSMGVIDTRKGFMVKPSSITVLTDQPPGTTTVLADENSSAHSCEGE